MIPKTIHQIWIGMVEIRSDHWDYIKKWKSMYPDFEHRLWTDRDVYNTDIIPPDKKKYFNTWIYPVAMKADILRYEIIRRYGGVYVDVDTEPLKRMDDLVLDCTCFNGIQPNGQVAIGIFGAQLNCGLMVDVCQSVVSNIEKKIEQGVDMKYVDQFTGPIFYTEMCEPYRNNSSYRFMTPNYFYPYWFTETDRKNEDFRTTCPDAYSVHHWSKSWG